VRVATPEGVEGRYSGRSGRRDFTLLWSASAASQLGTMCSATANPLLALLLTHSPVFAGWVGAASTAPALLMYLPAGWFVDRFDRRRLMFISQVGRLVVLVLLVCALAFGWHVAMLLLIVAALCEGIFQVLFSATEITAVQRVVDSADLSSALAGNEARSHLALLAAKPLGGLLFGLNKAFPYCVSAAATVLSIFALSAMKGYQPSDAEKSSGRTAENRYKISIAGGVKEVNRHHPFLRTSIIVCGIGNFFFQTVLLLLVVLAEQQRISSATIGALLATSGVGGLAGSIVAPRAGEWAKDGQKIIKYCVRTWVALTLIVAVSVLPPIGLPVIGLIAWGCLSVTGGFLNVAIYTYQAREVPEHMLGRVIGINRFLTSGAVPLGALCAGYIVAGIRPCYAAWLVFAVMLSILPMLPILSRSAEPHPHEEIEEPLPERVAVL
jgi:MFS family permease